MDDVIMDVMRLDKFLKIARIIKRRQVAKDICTAGHVLVNDKTAKAGQLVQVGDVIKIKENAAMHTYIVLRIMEFADAKTAASMYQTREDDRS